MADLLDGIVFTPVLSGNITLALDRGYDDDVCREVATAHGYTHPFPPKPARNGHCRRRGNLWVWFNRFRRVLIRHQKNGDNSLGFVRMAAALIIYRKVRHGRLLSG